MGRNLDFLWPPTSKAHAVAWVEETSKKVLDKDMFQWMIENNNGEAVGSIDTHTCNPRLGTFSYAVNVAFEHQMKGSGWDLRAGNTSICSGMG
jgi:hypothetical protein